MVYRHTRSTTSFSGVIVQRSSSSLTYEVVVKAKMFSLKLFRFVALSNYHLSCRVAVLKALQRMAPTRPKLMAVRSRNAIFTFLAKKLVSVERLLRRVESGRASSIWRARILWWRWGHVVKKLDCSCSKQTLAQARKLCSCQHCSRLRCIAQEWPWRDCV